MADGVQKNYPIFLGTTLISLESGILYRGYAKITTAVDKDKAIWRISREWVESGVTHIEHASFHHDQVWDDRASLFTGPAIPDPGSPGPNPLISKAPKIYNKVSPVTINTEFSQALSADTKKYLIRARGNATIQLAFVATESATKFITIPKGVSYTEESLDLDSTTLYMQVDKVSEVIEILEWT
jgi:hypothetical protein